MSDEITTPLALSQYFKKAVLRGRFKEYKHTLETANFSSRIKVAEREAQQVFDIADQLGLKVTIVITEKG